MEKEITQEERLDLTDKQVISEKEAYAKAVMANLQTPYKEVEKIIEFPLKQVIDNQERVIKEQKEEIERLQAQLDREIHINRKMKSALEQYAFETTKMEVPKFVGNSLQPQNEADLYSPMIDKPVYDGVEEVEVPYANDTSLAQQVLKEIDNKE